ncbi:MAG: hypothetical protein ABJA67_16025 [Chthonomonadales bacterium]
MNNKSKISTTDASSHIATILDRWENGETIDGAREDIPKDTSKRIKSATTKQYVDAISALQDLRKGITLGNYSVRELIDEGRR